jgi:dTMP kinase
MFLTFEGVDFSGKTTQARLLVDRLSPERKVCFLREPGGTPISERIREILLDRKTLDLTDEAELLLFSASRAQLVKQVIRPALGRGEIVICDRYYDSTTVYQGHGRGLHLSTVQTINAFATGSLVPDLTIIVDIPVEEIERRKHAAGKGFDRMESSGREFFERVRAGYRALCKEEPARVVRVDGMRPIERVHEEILDIVERKTGIHQPMKQAD